MDKIEKNIRENWFKNHKAEYTKINDSLRILNWENTKTNSYNLRYVMDGNFLYITGDLNSAVYQFKSRGILKLKSFKTIQLDYFYKNLITCERDNVKFNQENARKNIEGRMWEHIEYQSKPNTKFLDTLEEVYHLISECTSVQQFRELLIAEDLYNRLSNYNPDINEWIFDIGNDIPESIKSHFTGLQMAIEQLNIKGV